MTALGPLMGLKQADAAKVEVQLFKKIYLPPQMSLVCVAPSIWVHFQVEHTHMALLVFEYTKPVTFWPAYSSSGKTFLSPHIEKW